MPELPEVETIRRQLEKEIAGFKIIDLWTDSPKQVKPSPADFLAEVKGSKIIRIGRRAKLLIFELRREQRKKYFAVHLGMTGRLLLRKGGAPVDDFVHIVLSLQIDKLNPTGLKPLQLRFADARRFGYFQLVKDRDERDKILAGYGPEPLDDLNAAKFFRILQGTSRRIKEVLMDQKKISGIGNIYANDALWLARIHPERAANSLTKKEAGALFDAVSSVLKEGLETGGASDQWYRQIHGEQGTYQKHFRVYARRGQPCLRHPRQKIRYGKIGQRGTFYCPVCQRL